MDNNYKVFLIYPDAKLILESRNSTTLHFVAIGTFPQLDCKHKGTANLLENKRKWI